MPEKPNFDENVVHRYFAADCFNKTWDLMDKKDRTPEEDEQMIRLTLASHWHWTQRQDYTATSRSIGHWQTSRVYALVGQADNARRYGKLCLEASQEEGVEPFYKGYAYEALARAEAVAGNKQMAGEYVAQARKFADQVTEADDRQVLVNDLETIKV